MARSKLFHSVLIAGAVMAATPAFAQFGSIFRDNGPPRPPADVPTHRPATMRRPYYAPSQPPPPPPNYYPSQRDRRYSRRSRSISSPHTSSGSSIRTRRGRQPTCAPAPTTCRRRAAAAADEPAAVEPAGRGRHPVAGIAAAAGRDRRRPSRSRSRSRRTPIRRSPPRRLRRPGAERSRQPRRRRRQPAARRRDARRAADRGGGRSSRRRSGSPIRPRCSPASTRSPAASSPSTSRINETVQFGALQVTPRVCYSRPPTETPNTDAFVEVDEMTLQGEIRRIFTGWMFAASPGLHAVEHPIYDVWLDRLQRPAEPGGAPTPRRRAGGAEPRAEAAAAPAAAACGGAACSRARSSRPLHACRRSPLMRLDRAPADRQRFVARRPAASARSATKSASPTSAASSSW